MLLMSSVIEVPIYGAHYVSYWLYRKMSTIASGSAIVYDYVHSLTVHVSLYQQTATFTDFNLCIMTIEKLATQNRGKRKIKCQMQSV